MQEQRFEALSRICLNNWHYIDKKTLSFHEGVNFFTGHSGSGKSTVIDAMQILLYANTDGRAFFNKAAADDSDRNLMEYLRGMVNIGENNEFSFLRNRNFSTTIVMELRRTDTGECQSIGVAFDVLPVSNEVASRLFFWHKGPLLESGYRISGRAMCTDEIKEYLQNHYSKETYYFGPSNERFRKQLYDVYLGGLNMVRFPLLFKRAIPFKMNIKLEEFVKEYICMEEDIHIEDMQESVTQYGRMRQKIRDISREIESLKNIRTAYDCMKEKSEEYGRNTYFMLSMEIRKIRNAAGQYRTRAGVFEQDLTIQQGLEMKLKEEIARLEEASTELLKRISSTGYEELLKQLAGINEIIEHLNSSKAKWDRAAQKLIEWENCDIAPNMVLWDIGRFKNYSISDGELDRLKEALEELTVDAAKQKSSAEREIRDLEHKKKELQEELEELHQGKKAYPKELEEARRYIRRRFQEKLGKTVSVDILADLLDIRDDTWRNAVEGYLAGNKLLVIVEPRYARLAMELYQELDKEKFHGVAILDTEKVVEKGHAVQKQALADEVIAKLPYVRSYIDFMLGNVMKCSNIDELRKCRIGITSDCTLYHSYKLQYIAPDNYTRKAYIGEASTKKRVHQLEEQLEDLQNQLKPLLIVKKECEAILLLEHLEYPLEDYLEWKQDINSISLKEKEKKKLKKKLEIISEQNVDQWKKELEQVKSQCRTKRKLRDQAILDIQETERKIGECTQNHLQLSEELIEKEKGFAVDEVLESEVEAYLEEKTSPNYDRLRAQFLGKRNQTEEEMKVRMSNLRQVRYEYLKEYPNRTFSPESDDNLDYDELLNHLAYADLEELYHKANEQAHDAILLFKQDFIYKIRSAMIEALQRKDELNKIISKLDFGKDKYQFVIGKNKGADGKFYDMFMTEDLKVNPSVLTEAMDQQVNLFTLSHESNYGDLMNELISIFIPPDNATSDELEEAKHNMDKYADYRTYLSFDMQQIIEGEETIKIRLSKMLKKNSGGEGQNPLYVALLASFAQAYRINLSPKLQRSPTIRLVVLDEAFSKMDGEKVASCIELIRGLGFQAIISATNDKIQNYLENVDKTFVFANPNKKHISIQEFERREFAQLTEE